MVIQTESNQEVNKMTDKHASGYSKIVSEDDQEIPQLQTADKPVAS